MERVEIMHSDTHGVPFGQGSYGSRTFSVEGAAIYIAAQKIKAKALTVGAHMLQAKPEDVEFGPRRASRSRATRRRVKTLQEIASWLWFAWDLPPGVEPGLEATEYFNPSDFNFPFGSHVATVEIDEQTGEVDVVDYAGVDDVGVIGNEMIVEGQMQGSIAFGLGPALQEQVIYGDDGKLLTRNLTNYPVTRASAMPDFRLDHTVTPTPVNPMGAKGAGDVVSRPSRRRS